MSHSQASSPPAKLPRRLPRSPSDPMHLSHHQQQQQPQQPIYVLTADGSSLILLDPSKPSGNEQPPPYASFTLPDVGGGIADNLEHGAQGGVPFPSITPNLPSGSSSEILSPQPGGRLRSSEVSPHPRNRASTLSALSNERERSRPRLHSSLSHRERRTRSTIPTPESHTITLVPDERTPLLSSSSAVGAEAARTEGRGSWRSVFCGDLDQGEEAGSWRIGWNRFWRPEARSEYWRAMLHLVLLNFPFALFVWPPLVAGTLAGTALLITLPIGAAVWWLTLFISRSAARLETIMQLNYHSPTSASHFQPIYHPIFHRIKERSIPSSPQTPYSDIPYYSPNPTNNSNTDGAVVWEKRFMKCSYAMFLDHYSYSSLSYFLLIKPLITLFSTVVIIALLPVGMATIVGLPVYMRLLRRWGKWQAEVALENL